MAFFSILGFETCLGFLGLPLDRFSPTGTSSSEEKQICQLVINNSGPLVHWKDTHYHHLQSLWKDAYGGTSSPFHEASL